MSRSKAKTYSVEVSEEITARDNLNTAKRWFNGLKHFTTVKLIPPYNREGLTKEP